MGVEGGSSGGGGGIGGAVGGIGAGVGSGAGIGIGAGSAVEGGLTGAAAVAGTGFMEMPSLAASAVAELGGSLGKGLEFGPVMGLADMGPVINEGPLSVPSFINEGPVGLADLQATVPWQANIDVISQAGDVASRAWNASLESDAMPVGQPKIDIFPQIEDIAAKAWNTDADAITQTEEVLYQAQKPAIFSPVTLNHSVILNEVKDLSRMRVPNKQSLRSDDLELGDSSLITQNDNKSELAVLPQIEPMVIPFILPFPVPGILEFPKPKAVISPALEPAVQTGVRAAVGAVDKTEPAVTAQPVLQEQEVEEIVEEIVKEQDSKEVLEEEETTERKIIVEDEETSAQRKSDIRSAIKKAKDLVEQLGLKKITGAIVARFMHAEYAGVRSQIIKEKGPDGSYQETVETIAGSGEFESEAEAEEKSDKVVAEKKPAKYGKNSTPLAFEHVARVLKYFFGNPKPVEQMIIRVVKKRKVQTQERQKPSLVEAPKSRTKEPRIVNFPALSEACLPARQAFPKAA